MMFYVIAVLVVFVDQLCKILIRKNVMIDETFTLWGMQLTHIENSGMAGGLLQGYGRLFGIVAFLFVAGIIYYRKTDKLKGKMRESGFAFLVGGAVGNGIDRLFFGRVTDFLVSRSGKGVLNMADHAIEVGVLLLVISFVIEYLKSQSYKRCST
ncbi:signal peptidase II [Paenibacillus cremeus]|uniref:Lipoprotein signal peptidase n=1 Tax=Paenibacillus cremeus TaxID=2163881 RepID=A0A559JZX1_9BACL|nr:signal peptidase II [Paenibacillus cremeus]TVY05397.1 signal peptidase II [Paenibacillus cremeus]